MRRISSLFFVVCVLMFSACGGIKPSSGGSIKKYSESFYKQNGIVWFIKPIDFYAEKEKLEADFTYHSGDTIKQTTVVNISIYGTPPFAIADSATFFYPTGSYTSTSIKLLYNENVGKTTFSRQSIELPNNYFKAFLESEPVSIKLYHGDSQKNYINGKLWHKIHSKLYKMIFW